MNYAAEVTAFGRPFLAPLITPTIGRQAKDVVTLPPLAKVGLRIWSKILSANRGSSFAFILNDLPRAKNAIFVDASTQWGVGGCYGTAFFSFHWRTLQRFVNIDYIARMELLACIIALTVFRELVKDRLVTIYCDNANVVT